MKYQINQVVRVEIGDEIVGSPKGERRWTLGTVTAVSPRSGIHGDLVTVNISPNKEGGVDLVKRYGNASRILPGDMDDADYLAKARNDAAPLTAQQRANDLRAELVEKANKVQSVNLRANTRGGPHSTLDEVKLAAIFLHPQVREHASLVCDIGSEHMRECIAELEEALDLSNRSLKACDTERRHLLLEQSNLRTAAADSRAFKDQRDSLQLELNKLKALARQLTPEAVFSSAGKQRGFVLWCPTSSKPPKVVYQTYEKAVEVQDIMVKQHPNQVFHILAIGAGKKAKVVPATHTVETY